MKGIVAKVSESVFESVVREVQVILDLGLKLCEVNEVFDSEFFVYPNREQGVFVQVLYYSALPRRMWRMMMMMRIKKPALRIFI